MQKAIYYPGFKPTTFRYKILHSDHYTTCWQITLGVKILIALVELCLEKFKVKCLMLIRLNDNALD